MSGQYEQIKKILNEIEKQKSNGINNDLSDLEKEELGIEIVKLNHKNRKRGLK